MTIQTSLSPILIYTQDNLSMQQNLSHEGYPILTATDIDSAKTLIQQHYPQLIIVDKLHAYHELQPHVQIPTLLLCEHHEVDEAFTIGATDCLTKPIHPRLLQQRVHCLLRDTLAVFDNIPVMIQSLDKTRHIQYVNKHWLEVMGYEREEVIGQRLFNFAEVSHDEGDKIVSDFREKGSIRDVALQMRLKDGRTIDTLLDVNRIKNNQQKPYNIVVLRDVTELKQAEILIYQSQQQMESVLSAMTDVVLVIDKDGYVRQVVTPDNKAMLFSTEELVTKSMFEFFPHEKASSIVQKIRQVLESGDVARIEYDLSVNNQQYWFSASVSPLDESCVVWVSHAITHNKRAEADLRESEQRYRNLFEMATEGILIISLPDGQIVEANPHICEMLDYKRDDILTMNISEIEVAQNLNESSQNNATTSSHHFVVSATYQHNDGRGIAVETSSRIIQYHDKPAILCFIRDITARKRALEAEQEQRMLAEAMRDTAAAFNNTINLDEILDIVIEHCSHIVPHINSANIMLLKNGMAKIVRHYGYEEAGYTAAILNEMQLNLNDAPNLQWVKNQQHVLVIGDTHNSQFGWVHTQTSDFVRSIITAPIVVDGDVMGFINLDSDKVDTFSDKHGEHLQAFANQAAIAIKNARLFERLQQNAAKLDKSVQQRTLALSNANRALRQQIIQRQEAEDRLRDEQSLLHTLLDNIPDSVTVKDTKGRILLLNQEAKKVINLITDLPISDEFETKTVRDLHPDAIISQRLLERELRVIQNDEIIFNEEDSFTTLAGDIRSLLVTKVPLKDADGDIIGLIAINRDITELKQAQQKSEETLQQYSAELEARVKERTAALTLTNQALEQEINERKRAEDAERAQRILAEALRDGVTAINETLDRDSVLDTLLETMSGVVPHDAASIFLLEAPNMVRVVRQKGHDSIDNHCLDITHWANLQAIIQTGIPNIIEDTSLSPKWSKTRSSGWVRSNITVPIILDKQVEGFLNLDSKHINAFTEQHAQWLFAFAQQAGTAIRNARLVDAILSDSLTLQQRVNEQTAELASERAQLHAILNAMRDGVMYQVESLSNPPEYTNDALTDMTAIHAMIGFKVMLWMN
ncbi:MAG: PAS domain S-box protein [Anaerolineae bacterium]|nr:PAS domain S-box protein [Anaerolineae bacterium]